MSLENCFREQRKLVVDAWIASVYASYPLDTSGFLRTRKDQFANPVGHLTSQAAPLLYDSVAGFDVAMDEIGNALDEFVRLRAVQTFTPTEAVGVIYLLKPLLRKHILPEAEKGLLAEYLEAESRIDTLALLMFDRYALDREKIHSMRVDEVKSAQAQLLRRAERILARTAGQSDAMDSLD